MSNTAVKMAAPLSFAYDNVGTYHGHVVGLSMCLHPVQQNSSFSNLHLPFQMRQNYNINSLKSFIILIFESFTNLERMFEHYHSFDRSILTSAEESIFKSQEGWSSHQCYLIINSFAVTCIFMCLFVFN